MRDGLRMLRQAKINYHGLIVHVATAEAEAAGPAMITGLQNWMQNQGNLCRRTINDRIAWIKRAFRWAAENEYIPPEIVSRLEVARSLKAGRCKAPEGQGVKPVDWQTVQNTINHCPQKLATMITVHWFTGMRPGEVVKMRKSEIDQSGEIWIYKPKEHKNAYRGQQRFVPLGEHAKAALLPWWMKTKSDLLWEMQPLSYYRAIKRVNQKHNLKSWPPNQIRHSAATRLRKEIGIEAARVVLGHRSVSTTEIYAESDVNRAIEAMRKVG